MKNPFHNNIFTQDIYDLVLSGKESERMCFFVSLIFYEICLHLFWYLLVWINSNYFGQFVNTSELIFLTILSLCFSVFLYWLKRHFIKHTNVHTTSRLVLWQAIITIVYFVYTSIFCWLIGMTNMYVGVGLVSATVVGLLLIQAKVVIMGFSLRIFFLILFSCLYVLDNHNAGLLQNIHLPSLHVDMQDKALQQQGDLFWRFTDLYLTIPKAFCVLYLCSRLLRVFDDKYKNILYQAGYDALTGIRNRRYTLNWLQDAVLNLHPMNPQYSQSLRMIMPEYIHEDISVVILDIDFFKSVNDTYGHLAGDKVLIEFATILNNHISDDWIVGRYGGEEFLLVMPHTAHIRAMQVVENIRRYIESNPIVISEDQQVVVTSSFGVATLSHDEVLTIRQNYRYMLRKHSNEQKDMDIEQIKIDVTARIIDSLIDMADCALYDAKEGGRNRVISAMNVDLHFDKNYDSFLFDSIQLPVDSPQQKQIF